GTQALPVARAAGLRIVLVPLVPPDFLTRLLRVEAGHFDACAVAALAPAVLRVERKQTGIELGEAPATRRARSLRGEHRHGIGFRTEHVDEPLAEVERASERRM